MENVGTPFSSFSWVCRVSLEVLLVMVDLWSRGSSSFEKHYMGRRAYYLSLINLKNSTSTCKCEWKINWIFSIIRLFSPHFWRIREGLKRFLSPSVFFNLICVFRYGKSIFLPCIYSRFPYRQKGKIRKNKNEQRIPSNFINTAEIAGPAFAYLGKKPRKLSKVAPQKWHNDCETFLKIRGRSGSLLEKLSERETDRGKEIIMSWVYEAKRLQRKSRSAFPLMD